jgi:hypothetical protein
LNNEVEMDGACSMNVGEREHRLLMGKPELERPLGKPRSRWVDNSKIDI